MRLYHFDLYRLEGADALYEMGLDEFIPARDGACLIEWPERALEAMPEDALEIRMEYGPDGIGRRISLRPRGRFEPSRLEALLARMKEEEHEYSDD